MNVNNLFSYCNQKESFTFDNKLFTLNFLTRNSIKKTNNGGLMGKGEVFFGQWLKEKRELAGLSQVQLAEKVDVSRGYITALEGGTRTPSVELVDSLAEALGLTRVEARIAAHLHLDSELTTQQRVLIEQFTTLPIEVQEDVLAIMETLARRHSTTRAA